jgi:hypothetical protein
MVIDSERWIIYRKITMERSLDDTAFFRYENYDF